ncbi:hypothetical protein [Cohnella boryungensis]|uniref:Uncharacterized protein n=1 Tax=Cohnella boryungensis TaxID=768479 RepID=A0ABV8SEN5_9BACL
MMNRDFSGCAVATFSKRMNDNTIGTITIEGKQLKKAFIYNFSLGRNVQLLGIPVRGVVNEYDKSYTALVEGFVDADGMIMDRSSGNHDSDDAEEKSRSGLRRTRQSRVGSGQRRDRPTEERRERSSAQKG